jgi:hypothetical protein
MLSFHHYLYMLFDDDMEVIKKNHLFAIINLQALVRGRNTRWRYPIFTCLTIQTN